MNSPTPPRRKRDPERVRANILEVASREIAAHGLNGVRIDEIAAKTQTSKRMIYYYFGDKEGLYQQVLEEADRTVREQEQALQLPHLPAVEALKRLVMFTFDHHRNFPEFIRLVMVENIHEGRHLSRSSVIHRLNQNAIRHLSAVYQRGLCEQVFREGLTPLELHWEISALCFFYVSNQTTFSTIFGNRFWTPDGMLRHRRQVLEMVLRFTLRPECLDQHLA